MGNDPLYPAVEVSSPKDAPIRYSFCTLVTDQMQYRNMLASFQEAGFSTDDCEYLYLDNRAENRFDGYRGLNHLIAQASGRYVVLCHQDVLPFDNRATLDNRLLELFERDPDWAVAGNAGYDADRKKRFRLTHPYGFNIDTGGLPAAVETLDENFLILRRDSLLGFSHDLRGFHLYGTDLVTQARLRGRTSWVIDFHLEHLGVGTVDGSFMDSVDAFQNKYRHALRPRAVRSTVVKLAVGGTDLEARLKQWEKRYRIKNGKKPFARIGKLDFSLRRFRQFMGDLSRGGTYSLDGTAFSVPNTAPLSARKALTKGTYEKAERDLVREWLPADLPAIELGGSYGIVSHTIRTALSPDARLVVVEANPALIETCTANLSLAGQADRTKVVAAALAYGDARTVRFAVTEAQHTSHVTDNADEPGGTIEVPAVTLAGLLKTEGIDGPFSLVCDIEGAELALLRNEPEVLKSCACLVMELHPQAFRAAGSSLHEVTDLIGKAGLEIVEQREQVIVARPR